MDVDEDPTLQEEQAATELKDPDALSDTELPNTGAQEDYVDEFPPPLKIADVKGKGKEPEHAHDRALYCP